MMTSDERRLLWQQLLRHEGIRLKVYKDSVGVPTIGVGRNLRDKGITETEAMMLLDHDIEECERDCETFPWFETLDPVRRRVILNMRFNLGPKGLRLFKNTLAAVAAKEYVVAARAMLSSKWARQVGKRATELAEMMRLGVDKDTPPPEARDGRVLREV